MAMIEKESQGMFTHSIVRDLLPILDKIPPLSAVWKRGVSSSQWSTRAIDWIVLR